MTVTVAVPLLPSLAAAIVAEPAAAPITRPLASTVATAGLVVDHVTARPFSALPLASSGVAVSCAVCPTATLAVAGLTDTNATGTTMTAIAAVSALAPPFWVAIAL